jgi:hypothetical protein
MDSPPAPGEDSIIHVFAAWPKEWEAEFTLAARGGFLVTSMFRNGSVSFVELKSQVGGGCLVKNPWSEDVTIFRNNSNAGAMGGNVLKFNTEEGETILIVKGANSPLPVMRTVRL